ncbi:unnamed protein product [Agarophyton chilense]
MCASRPRRTLCVNLSLSPQQTEKLLNFAHANNIEKMLAQNMLALSERAVRERTILTSHFLTPLESSCVLDIVRAIRDTRAMCWGGYGDAERRLLVVGCAYRVEDEQRLLDAANHELVVVKLEGKFDERTTHRDFMGAVLSSGLDRSQIGDISVLDGQRGAQVITKGEAARILQGSVQSVRRATVSTRVEPISELEETQRVLKEVNSVESSLRLDAVGSGGLNMSRAQFSKLLEKGLVCHNQHVARNGSKRVEVDDTISARGVGKLRVQDVSRTKRGRFRVSMMRFM